MMFQFDELKKGTVVWKSNPDGKPTPFQVMDVFGELIVFRYRDIFPKNAIFAYSRINYAELIKTNNTERLLYKSEDAVPYRQYNQ